MQDLVELAAVPALVVVGEPLEDDPLVRDVFRDAIRAAAGGVVLEPLVGEGVLLGLVGFDGRRVDDEGTVLGGHRRQEEGLGAAEVEADRRRVDDLHLLRVLDEPADHVDRAGALEQEAGEGALDRLGVARRAVVERGAGSELEGVGRLVLADLPRLGQHRLELVGAAPLELEQHLVGGQEEHRRQVVVGVLGVEVGEPAQDDHGECPAPLLRCRQPGRGGLWGGCPGILGLAASSAAMTGLAKPRRRPSESVCRRVIRPASASATRMRVRGSCIGYSSRSSVGRHW